MTTNDEDCTPWQPCSDCAHAYDDSPATNKLLDAARQAVEHAQQRDNLDHWIAALAEAIEAATPRKGDGQ